MSVSIEARNNAARRRDEDLAACAAYVETEAGATGQQNADVLGRLLIDAQARIDLLEKVEADLRARLERIGTSLESVVSERLLDLRQRVEVIEKDLQGANLPRLPEGVTRSLG